MFRPIETNDVRTVWIDSIDEFTLGFENSTRVVTNRRTDTEYECELLSGLWPDDHELVLMCLNREPDHEESDIFMREFIPDDDEHAEHIEIDESYDAPTREKMLTKYARGFLIKKASIFPPIHGMKMRTIVLDEMLVRQRVDTFNTASGGMIGDPDRMAFDEWRIRLDVALKVSKLPTTETMPEGVFKEGLSSLRELHDKGVTPDNVVKIIKDKLETINAGDGKEGG